MEVHPAWRHQQSSCINHRAADALLDEVRPDRRDARPNNADLSNGIEILARIDHPAVAKDQIEHDSVAYYGPGRYPM